MYPSSRAARARAWRRASFTRSKRSAQRYVKVCIYREREREREVCAHRQGRRGHAHGGGRALRDRDIRLDGMYKYVYI